MPNQFQAGCPNCRTVLQFAVENPSGRVQLNCPTCGQSFVCDMGSTPSPPKPVSQLSNPSNRTVAPTSQHHASKTPRPTSNQRPAPNQHPATPQRPATSQRPIPNRPMPQPASPPSIDEWDMFVPPTSSTFTTNTSTKSLNSYSAKSTHRRKKSSSRWWIPIAILVPSLVLLLGVGGYIAWSSGGSLASIADSLPMSDSHEQLMNEYYDSMKKPELYFGAHEGAPPIPQDVPPFLEKMARRAVKLGFIDNPEQRHEFIAVNENSESRKQYFQVMNDFRRNGPPKDSNGPTPADANQLTDAQRDVMQRTGTFSISLLLFLKACSAPDLEVKTEIENQIAKEARIRMKAAKAVVNAVSSISSSSATRELKQVTEELMDCYMKRPSVGMLYRADETVLNEYKAASLLYVALLEHHEKSNRLSKDFLNVAHAFEAMASKSSFSGDAIDSRVSRRESEENTEKRRLQREEEEKERLLAEQKREEDRITRQKAAEEARQAAAAERQARAEADAKARADAAATAAKNKKDPANENEGRGVGRMGPGGFGPGGLGPGSFGPGGSGSGGNGPERFGPGPSDPFQGSFPSGFPNGPGGFGMNGPDSFVGPTSLRITINPSGGVDASKILNSLNMTFRINSSSSVTTSNQTKIGISYAGELDPIVKMLEDKFSLTIDAIDRTQRTIECHP